MSYNIDSIDYLTAGNLIISKQVMDEYEDEVPEICFINDSTALVPTTEQDHFHIKYVWWSGEGSGGKYDLLKEVLSKTRGEADLLLCWEGGAGYTGLRVKDGKVTEHKVEFSLGEQVG